MSEHEASGASPDERRTPETTEHHPAKSTDPSAVREAADRQAAREAERFTADDE